MSPSLPRATATERTYLQVEEDGRCGGLELNGNVTSLPTHRKRFRMLALFSKEHLAVFILCINFAHVFLL